ncbi:MAG: hypothetical protein IVW36_04185 [Dehalococcoidia bacterium]|nr:hypothetical protein [Dehalococcoidia bacterium]
MTSSARTPVSALPRGHAFTPARFTPQAADVRAYLDAVGDGTSYGDAVPPLAALALGLAALQEQLSLPAGSLHTGQEVEQLAVMRAGEDLTLSGEIAQRSERQGLVISVIALEVAAAGAPALRARTTILVPAASS